MNPADAVAKCVKPKSVTVPNPENTEKYRKVFLEYKKIHDALAPDIRREVENENCCLCKAVCRRRNKPV